MTHAPLTYQIIIDQPSSLAAAASGFLKVLDGREPAKSSAHQETVLTGAGLSIADAAKAGFLAIPTAGEKKGIWNSLYVVYLIIE